jgi:hypothetical protein
MNAGAQHLPLIIVYTSPLLACRYDRVADCRGRRSTLLGIVFRVLVEIGDSLKHTNVEAVRSALAAAANTVQ